LTEYVVGVEEAGWLADGLGVAVGLFSGAVVLVGATDELVVSSGAGIPCTKPIKPQLNTTHHVKYRSIPVLLK
jgi:hypothetical protein